MSHDAIFASDNDYGIPLLLEERQAEFLVAPCKGWGSISRSQIFNGTWHFYADDYRWSAILQKPWQVTDTQPVVCVEPNFSIMDDMPVALVIERTYRKRWLARYWQGHNIKIFVDLYVPAHHQHWNLLGVPHEWRAFATRGSSRDIHCLTQDYQIACRHAGTEDIQFAVFGGGKKVKEWCQRNRAIHVAYASTKNAHSAGDWPVNGG